MSETPIFPVRKPQGGAGTNEMTLSSLFGYRSAFGGQYHTGIDIIPFNEPSRFKYEIVASLSGIVTIKEYSGGGGNTIAIDSTSIGDGNVYRFIYQHLNKFADGLKIGQNVNQGDIIGNMGGLP
jgi:murein DD-endopeptidase MepM/ murein hydrolase activator NlpD